MAFTHLTQELQELFALHQKLVSRTWVEDVVPRIQLFFQNKTKRLEIWFQGLREYIIWKWIRAKAPACIVISIRGYIRFFLTELQNSFTALQPVRLGLAEANWWWWYILAPVSFCFCIFIDNLGHFTLTQLTSLAFSSSCPTTDPRWKEIEELRKYMYDNYSI